MENQVVKEMNVYTEHQIYHWSKSDDVWEKNSSGSYLQPQQFNSSLLLPTVPEKALPARGLPGSSTRPRSRGRSSNTART